MKQTRRQAVLAAIARREWLLQMLALSVAGCARRAEPLASRASTLIMAVDSIDALRPDFTDADFLVFSPLLERNERGDFVPRLAERWEHSDDYREWTYHLRRDVRWHDGVPVTAHDIKFSLGLVAQQGYRFDSVTVLDDFTVKVRVPPGYHGPGYQDDIVYYPKHLLEGLDAKKFEDWDFWTHPVGNGPFRFVRYQAGTMIEFEANPDYYRGKPKIGRLVLKFVGPAEGGAGLTELLSSNVDVVLAGNSSQIPRVVEDPRFRVYYSAGGAGGPAIVWKCDHPLFRDARVRRALTLAIDRPELRQLLNLPADLPFGDGVYTYQQAAKGEVPELLPHDPAEAQALFEAAGWHDRDGDGIRERDGRPFRFTAILSSGRDLPRLAVAVQAQLRRVRVQMDIQVMDRSVVERQRIPVGDFEAAVVRSNRPMDQKRFFGRGNPTGYANVDAFRLIDSIEAAQDPDEVDRLYRELSDVYRADLPTTRLAPIASVAFAHRRVQGLRTPFHANPDRFMEDLWLDDRVKD